MRKHGWIVGLALALALIAAPAFAQGGSQAATLAGVVTDVDGGVVPGATVVVKNNATGETLTGVTNSSGAYSFPGLAPGTYTVTVSLSGFKTAEYKEVRLLAGTTNSISTKLEIGTISEVVNVTAGTDLVRTQTPTVSSTVNADFIQTLPRSDRNALNFLIFLPGVTTIGGAGSARSSTVSGLPQNTINITIDGISNSNLLQSGDGFFSMVVPRLDAVEEVTMTSATAGADATGQGAVQIRFVTRSGTNTFETSLYTFMQHKAFNSNAFFTRLSGNPRPVATNYTYGGRVGGPIIIPKLFDGRGKAFFFFNQEEVYAPIETLRTRTIIRESALAGDFTYNLTNPTTVNVLSLAASKGQLATYDPVVKTILESIRAAASTKGSIQQVASSPNTASLAWLVPSEGVRHTPTTNITVNITPKHRVQGAYYWQRFNNTPDTLNSADPSFPGFPHFGDQSSFRTTASMNLRSTLSQSMVNELRGGWQWSPLDFFGNETKDMFANTGGYYLNLGFGLTNPAWGGFSNGPSARNTWNWTIDDNFNWLKGSHSLSFGGNFTRIINWTDDWNTTQQVNLGFNSTFDPAEVLFNTTNGPVNFPGSSTSDRNSARALYALLTGRVSSLPGTGRLNEAGDTYIYNGHIIQRERMDEYSLFAQDSWRWKPTVTVTAGVRYELQYPMIPTNGVFTTATTEYVCGPSGFGNGVGGRFCNIFNPGVLNNPTVVPQFLRYDANSKGYNVDYNNIAPNVGVSWRPNVQSGWLRQLLGDPEQATVSTGFSRSYNRERMDRFTAVFSGNPGGTTPATRSTSTTAFPLVLPGESWPILFRDTGRLGAPGFLQSPVYPIIATPSNNMRVFDPDIQVPYTDSWQVGLQRSLGKDMAVELRYIGNQNKLPWSNENWNALNIYETGFLDEYKLAAANLHANVLAGRGANFKYYGPGTGTSPLPIFMAHFSALPASAAQDPANYTSTLWSSTTFTGNMDPFFPNPSGIASTLYTGTFTPSGSSTAVGYFTQAKSTGYPTNFWVMNPLANAASVMRNLGGSRTNQVIVELRRRLSGGLAVNGSYTWSRTISKSNQDLHLPLFDLRSTGVPHAFKMLWTYDIPVGRGKRFGSNMNAWLDSVVGGWTFSGTGRVQIQSFVLRDAVIVGMTQKEAQKALKQVRFVVDPVSGAVTVWNFPQDIIDNTRRAYNTDETQPTFYAPGTEPTGRYFAPASSLSCMVLYPGDCGTKELWFYGRWFGEFDFRIAKQFKLPGKARFEFSAEVFNALMAKNFPVSFSPSNSANVFRITSTQSGARTAQLVWRVTW